MKTPVWTWLPGVSDPVLAGQLAMIAGQGKLWYEQAYMDMAHARALDPIQLRFSRKNTGIPLLQNGGLPGVVADAMPAGYGADRLHAQHDRTLTPLELLEFGPADGVGAIEVCHDIERKLAWQPHTLDELKTYIQELEETTPASRAIRRLLDDATTSAGGERPKLTLQHQGKLWLAKLQDRGDAPHLPAREYIVMRMASELDLQVPEVRLETHAGREVFLIERFDRVGDPLHLQRHLFASAHTVLGLSANTLPGDARRSYLVLADQMRRWISDPQDCQQDLQELWRRMAYNALVGNGDDHPRNHGLLHDGTGWRLSKVFDITPLPTFNRILAMSVTADGSQECSAHNLLSAAPHLGMSLRDAAAWLGDAAAYVAQSWEQLLQDQGVPVLRIAQFRPAFAFATELAENPELLEQALTSVEQQTRRKGQRNKR
ncbi:MAG: HipA domain-containing protein [Giesbergeria sp.]|uniref:type II toxin-antitoxin system HipA family toxin n=1 Tax=Giesbergeria sp. TaxID=2818473 RepID=UPI00260CAE27|nr:HipA domain-containing protein [Giesbergeria sp.]MDD2609342.1 HipA domain-containing protein [Giesbergeria sp.]